MSSSGNDQVSGGGGGDNPPGRPIRDMQGLLRFALQGTAAEDASGDNVPTQMDPERRAWLENVLQNMSVDVIKEMLTSIENIKKELETLNRDNREEGECDEAIENILTSIDNLMDRVEDLDIASDFHKIGGFQILPELLKSPYPSLKMKGAELVAGLVQNHEYCQKAALDINILGILVELLNSNAVKDSVKVKALYAVSCLIRHNSSAQDIFENTLDGYSTLLTVMQSTSEDGPKLRTKSAFLLSSIVQETPKVKETLFKMGFIEQLVALLHGDHDLSHEHLLSALLNFVSDFEPGVEECRRSELQLNQLLKNRLTLLINKPENLEEVGYCKQILGLCFGTESLGISETER